MSDKPKTAEEIIAEALKGLGDGVNIEDRRRVQLAIDAFVQGHFQLQEVFVKAYAGARILRSDAEVSDMLMRSMVAISCLTAQQGLAQMIMAGLPEEAVPEGVAALTSDLKEGLAEAGDMAIRTARDPEKYGFRGWDPS